MSATSLSLATQLVASALYCVATVCCGHAALGACARIADLPERRGVDGLLTAFVAGCCVLAVLWQALALAGWLTLPAVIAALTLFTLIGVTPAWHNRTEWRHTAADQVRWWRTQGGGFRLATSLAVLLIMLFAIGALIKPPIGDAEAFYMVYPVIIADSERLVPMPGLYAAFSQIGLFGELQFAALIKLAGVAAAKFLLWPLAIVAALLLARICTVAGLGRRGVWFAIIILFTSTTFTDYIADGKVELFAAALGLAAFYWSLSAEVGAGARAALALVGLLAGFACVAKISYLAAFLPPLYFLVGWRRWQALAGDDRRARGVFSALAQLTFWICAAWIPQFLKNAQLFDAPFAPFFGVSDAGIISQTWFSPEVTRRIILTYPFALAFGRYPMQGGNLSFLLLAFLPLALLLPRARSLLRSTLAQLTIAALIGLAIWIAVRPSVIAPRYLLATLLLFVPLAARAAEAAYAGNARNDWLRLGILATVVAALTIFIYPVRKLPWELAKHALGLSPACRLASPYCAPLLELNRHAAPGDRVFFAGYYGFWLRPDLLQCRDGANELKLIDAASGVPWTALAERGFRFVVVDPTSHGKALEQLRASPPPKPLAVSVLTESPALVIYKIDASATTRPPLAQCRRLAPPAWDIVVRP